ncbi:MAG: BolA/IbaG family iron-sulfur metabolism protein [Methylotetracoccus sp.]
MDIETIDQMIRNALPDARVLIDGEGCSFSVTVVSQGFDGYTTVKRQKMVLAALEPALASGALHAISMKTHTPGEWTDRVSHAQPIPG